MDTGIVIERLSAEQKIDFAAMKLMRYSGCREQRRIARP